MRLYHGSNIAIDNINLAMCRPYKDFGQGFQLTDIEEQAEYQSVDTSHDCRRTAGNPQAAALRY